MKEHPEGHVGGMCPGAIPLVVNDSINRAIKTNNQRG